MIGVPLGLPGFQILGQALTTQGTLEVTIISNVDRAVCPRCGRVSPKQHDCRQRRKRDVSLGEHRVVLVLCKRRFCCLACGRSFTEPDAICGWRRRTTVRLREEVGKQACSRSITHVAVEQEVGPRFVQTCLQSVAQTRLAKQGHTLDEERPLPPPRFLGIDEFARRKGQRYDTLVCDLEGRRVLEVAAGRTHAQVCSVLERLDEPDRVEAVSMDMSLVFREAVRLCLPRARIVADHFHVVQQVGKALGKVVRRAAASQAGRAALKGRSHLFLRPQETLTPEEESTRSELAAAFPEVHIAWQHKEALRHWYAHATAATAAAELDLWLATVEREGPADLREALAAFRTWRIEILAFFHFLPTRISNGFVEGKNNRTKALMRQAYGYRNRRHLRLRILLGAA